jgi:hypothetical protein
MNQRPINPDAIGISGRAKGRLSGYESYLGSGLPMFHTIRRMLLGFCRRTHSAPPSSLTPRSNHGIFQGAGPQGPSTPQIRPGRIQRAELPSAPLGTGRIKRGPPAPRRRATAGRRNAPLGELGTQNARREGSPDDEVGAQTARRRDAASFGTA